MFRGQYNSKLRIQAENATLKCLHSLLSLHSFPPETLPSLSHLKALLPLKNKKAKSSYRQMSAKRFSIVAVDRACGLASHRIREEIEELCRNLKYSGPNISKESGTAQGKQESKSASVFNLVRDDNIWESLKLVGERKSEQLASRLNLITLSEESSSLLLSSLQTVSHETNFVPLFSELSLSEKTSNLEIQPKSKFFNILKIQNESSPLSWNALMNLLDTELADLSRKRSKNTLFVEFFQNLKLTLVPDNSQIKLREFSNLQAFLQKMSEKQAIGNVERMEFWQKMAYLLRKPSKYHDFIGAHLRAECSQQICYYFDAIVSGKQVPSPPLDHCLFNSNSFYREFMLILDRRYVSSLSRETFSRRPDQMLSIALKQIHLSLLLQENPLQQLQFLSNHARQRLVSFESALMTSEEEEALSLLSELILLGQASEIVLCLERQGKIDQVQSLFLLSPLLFISLEASSLLLYQPKETVKTFQTIIKKAVLSDRGNSASMCTKVLQIFLPLLRPHLEDPEKFFAQTITTNLELFRYIASALPFWEFCLPLKLSIQDLPRIFDCLLEAHFCFSFCSQLAISLFIPLEDFFIMMNSKEGQSSLPSRTKLLRKKSFSELQLKDKMPFDALPSLNWEDFDPIIKTEIFLQLVSILARHGSNLLKNQSRRSCLSEDIVKANSMFSLLKKKQLKECLLTKNSGEKLLAIQEKLPSNIRLLSFVFSLVSLKTALCCSQYETIVKVLNLFLEDLSDHLDSLREAAAQVLGKTESQEVMMLFRDYLIQGMVLMQQSKPRIVAKNKLLFKVLCRQLVEGFFSKGSNDPSEEVCWQQRAATEEQLTQFLSEVNHLWVNAT